MLFLKLLLSTSLIFGETAKDSNLAVHEYRLPDYVKPMHYELEIKLPQKEEAKSFVGKYSAHIIIDRPTRNISLHSQQLEIDFTTIFLEKRHTSINNSNPTLYTPKNSSYNNESHIRVFHFDQELATGIYVLNMFYVGSLLDYGEGLVKMFYYEKSNPVKKT